MIVVADVTILLFDARRPVFSSFFPRHMYAAGFHIFPAAFGSSFLPPALVIVVVRSLAVNFNVSVNSNGNVNSIANFNVKLHVNVKLNAHRLR